MGSAALHRTCLCDVSKYLRMVDSRLFSRIQSPFFPLPLISTTLAYVLEDTVMHSAYAQTTFVNAFLFPDVYFVFFEH